MNNHNFFYEIWIVTFCLYLVELRKDEVYMPWVASQTSLPAAKAKLIMLLSTCNVKAYAKYKFLDEIDEQCRSPCVQKPGTAGSYFLHVTRNSTKAFP